MYKTGMSTSARGDIFFTYKCCLYIILFLQSLKEDSKKMPRLQLLKISCFFSFASIECLKSYKLEVRKMCC